MATATAPAVKVTKSEVVRAILAKDPNATYSQYESILAPQEIFSTHFGNVKSRLGQAPANGVVAPAPVSKPRKSNKVDMSVALAYVQKHGGVKAAKSALEAKLAELQGELALVEAVETLL